MLELSDFVKEVITVVVTQGSNSGCHIGHTVAFSLDMVVTQQLSRNVHDTVVVTYRVYQRKPLYFILF